MIAAGAVPPPGQTGDSGMTSQPVN